MAHIVNLPPKKHHWVPRCYLRNFLTTGGGERLYMYRKTAQPILVGIDNIAAQNNLYTFKDKRTGEPTTEAETFFSKIEGDAAPILEAIARDKKLVLTEPQRISLIAFIGFLATRGPSMRDWLRNMEMEGFKIRMQAVAADPEILRAEFAKAGITFESDQELEEMRETLLDFDNRIRMESTGGEAGLFRDAMELSQDLMELFYRKKSMHLLTTSHNRPFVTSDNPMAIQRLAGIPWHLNGGYEYGTIFVPISPEVCLVMRSIPLRDSVIEIGPKWVDKINRSIMRAAHQQLYSNISSRTLMRAFDEFPARAISKVKSQRWRGTPYVMTSGLEADDEVAVLGHHSMSVEDLANGSQSGQTPQENT